MVDTGSEVMLVKEAVWKEICLGRELAAACIPLGGGGEW